MAFPHQHQSPVRNGLLAALPPEDLARLRPSLQSGRTPLRPDALPVGRHRRGGAVPRERHGVPARHAGRRGAGRGRDRRPGGPDRPAPHLRRRPLADRGQGATGGHGAPDGRGGPARRDGGERRAAGRAAALRPGLALASHADRRVQRAPRDRATPRPLAAHRPRPRGRRRVRHDARVHGDDARRAPPRRLARRRAPAKGRADPVRPRPDGRHRPARPRSHELRVLPRRPARVRAPARVRRRDRGAARRRVVPSSLVFEHRTDNRTWAGATCRVLPECGASLRLTPDRLAGCPPKGGDVRVHGKLPWPPRPNSAASGSSSSKTSRWLPC